MLAILDVLIARKTGQERNITHKSSSHIAVSCCSCCSSSSLSSFSLAYSFVCVLWRLLKWNLWIGALHLPHFPPSFEFHLTLPHPLNHQIERTENFEEQNFRDSCKTHCILILLLPHRTMNLANYLQYKFIESEMELNQEANSNLSVKFQNFNM